MTIDRVVHFMQVNAVPPDNPEPVASSRSALPQIELSWKTNTQETTAAES